MKKDALKENEIVLFLVWAATAPSSPRLPADNRRQEALAPSLRHDLLLELLVLGWSGVFAMSDPVPLASQVIPLSLRPIRAFFPCSISKDIDDSLGPLQFAL